MGLLKKCKCSCAAYLFGGGKNSSAGLVGSPLEKVLSTAGGEEKYVIYRLVSHRHGGLLVELFQKKGIKEVERYVREELPQYLYNEGRGENVTLSDYLRWKNSVGTTAEEKLASVDLTMESVMVAMHRPDPFNKFEEHEACWKLEYRGALGETLLHVLVTCDTPTHTKIAKVLLDLYPKMALDVVEGLEYFGTSALHLAVAYSNMTLVSALIECGSDLNRRATGRFFLPTDQQMGPRRDTDYSGLSYLGEYALSWAACAENEAAYNMLLDHGSDPNLQDSLGNMVLHMVVIADKLDMYSYALRHPKRPANNEIVNRAGLTPLALACTLGRDEIFREMLELSSVEFWRYSNITCSAYPLSALDSILPDGKTNWKSALMIILNGETDEHLDMLGSGVVQRLLEDKWKTFARKQFLFRLALLFLHLLVLSIGVYLRPRVNESLLGGVDVKSVMRYCAELATCGGCAMFVLVQQGGEIRSQGLSAFLLSLTRAPPKLIFLVSNILILICIPLRLLSMRSVEDSLLLFAVPGSWFFLMFFAGAVRLTGPFVTMIYSMISGDMVRFGIIYLVVLLGFSQVFYFLFKSCHRSGVKCKDDDSSIQIYGTYAGTWMALYQMTLGNHQYQDFSLPEYSTLSLVVFVIFMVMVPILLLNMLTAMMGNTYSTIISKSEKEFFKQWAKIVLTQERAVSPGNAAMYLDQYAINLAPSATDGEIQKGLVVIKSKSKTKARQRKGALLNWKKIGKKAIKEMRTHGCTGDVLLEKVAEANERKAARRPAPGKGRVLEHCDIQSSSSSSSSDSEEAAAEAAREGLGNAISQMAWHHDLNIEAGLVGSGNPSPSPLHPIKPPPKKSGKASRKESKSAMKHVAALQKMARKSGLKQEEEEEEQVEEQVEGDEEEQEEVVASSESDGGNKREDKLGKWREKAGWVAKADGVVREVQRRMEMEDDDPSELVAMGEPAKLRGKEGDVLAKGAVMLERAAVTCDEEVDLEGNGDCQMEEDKKKDVKMEEEEEKVKSEAEDVEVGKEEEEQMEVEEEEDIPKKDDDGPGSTKDVEGPGSKKEDESVNKKGDEEAANKKDVEETAKKLPEEGSTTKKEPSSVNASVQVESSLSWRPEEPLRKPTTTTFQRPRTPHAASESNSGEDSDPRPGPLLLPPINKQKRRKQKRGSLKVYSVASGFGGQGQAPSSSPSPSPKPSPKPVPRKKVRMRRNNKVGVSDGSPSSADTTRPEAVLCPERPRTAHMTSAAWSTAPIHSLSSLLAVGDRSESKETG